MFFSVIIPVYNRPDEIDALLHCFTLQLYANFEVLVIESGSTIKSDLVVEKYASRLDVSYYLKGNDGQGFSRNYGFERAKGDYFVVIDSDVLLDPDFLQNIYNHLQTNYLDCYGGPDKLHPSSTDIQKAINYSMTSFYTTGGIRGNDNHVGKFYPRSFNMGFSKEVYNATQGFKLPFFGEDIELSARIMSMGFKTGLISSAHVYHKRKTNFADFFKQMHFFGRARINIYKHFPDTLKIVHFFPACFLLYIVLTPWFSVLFSGLSEICYLFLQIYFILIFVDSWKVNRDFKIAFLSLFAVLVQMFGYGTGFIKDYWNKVLF